MNWQLSWSISSLAAKNRPPMSAEARYWEQVAEHWQQEAQECRDLLAKHLGWHRTGYPAHTCDVGNEGGVCSFCGCTHLAYEPL